MDEVFCFRGQQKLYLYRAVDQHGQVIDVVLIDKLDRVSAEAFFRQAFVRTEVTPTAVITAHHQPNVRAVATVLPFAPHVRRGLPRHHGYTTQPVIAVTSSPVTDSEAPESSEPFTLDKGL